VDGPAAYELQYKKGGTCEDDGNRNTENSGRGRSYIITERNEGKMAMTISEAQTIVDY
jgi:hypothetical protein